MSIVSEVATKELREMPREMLSNHIPYFKVQVSANLPIINLIRAVYSKKNSSARDLQWWWLYLEDVFVIELPPVLNKAFSFRQP